MSFADSFASSNISFAESFESSYMSAAAAFASDAISAVLSATSFAVADISCLASSTCSSCFSVHAVAANKAATNNMIILFFETNIYYPFYSK